MRISKVVRRDSGDGRSSVNAVLAANVGEDGRHTATVSGQHVDIVQKGGGLQSRRARRSRRKGD